MLMKLLGEYSNGWGHVVVTLAALVFAGVILYVSHDVAAVLGVVGPILTFWYGSAVANKIAAAKMEAPPIQLEEPKP